MSGAYEIETPTDDICDPLYDMETMRKDALGEFAGTFLFIYIGLSGVNQSVINGGGDLVVALCFAVGLTAGIFVAGKSGGHLNPAVSFTALITSADFDLRRFILYTCAQMLGSFCAASLVMIQYYSFINNYKHKELFAGKFGTVKSPNVSLTSAIIDQFIGSALLMLAILIIPDNIKYKSIAIGASLGALALFQGVNGFSFNPIRDCIPRIVSSFVIGKISFSAGDYWFWVPIIVPFVAMPAGFIIAKMLKRLE